MINQELHSASQHLAQKWVQASKNDKLLSTGLWEDNYFCIKDPPGLCNVI